MLVCLCEKPWFFVYVHGNICQHTNAQMNLSKDIKISVCIEYELLMSPGKRAFWASHWKWDLDFHIGVWVPPEILRLIFLSTGCIVWSVPHGSNPRQRLLENLNCSCGFHVQSTLWVAEEGETQHRRPVGNYQYKRMTGQVWSLELTIPTPEKYSAQLPLRGRLLNFKQRIQLNLIQFKSIQLRNLY